LISERTKRALKALGLPLEDQGGRELQTGISAKRYVEICVLQSRLDNPLPKAVTIRLVDILKA